MVTQQFGLCDSKLLTFATESLGARTQPTLLHQADAHQRLARKDRNALLLKSEKSIPDPDAFDTPPISIAVLLQKYALHLAESRVPLEFSHYKSDCI